MWMFVAIVASPRIMECMHVIQIVRKSQELEWYPSNPSICQNEVRKKKTRACDIKNNKTKREVKKLRGKLYQQPTLIDD